ncbi:winged helix-turn-helix domain-containing protein [Haloarchaeobius sp. DFWS5]|uniref:winged helix-turn-helix domain-containing protein n=1 Tax=Haloarchaeobius sp. DFWS5 TaxID=3446114 RepID=UPI003EB7BA45
MDDTATRTPEAAYGLVANETRLAILRALWEADEKCLSFSELRDAVGMKDTGQFNYHLSKLVGTFIDRVESDDTDDDGASGRDGGYEIRYAGLAVLGAILSGVYTRETSVGPVPVGAECMDCGAGLEARYEDERATVACTDCGEQFMGYSLPPGVVEGRDGDDLPAIISDYLYTVMTQVTAGFCPICTGQMVPEPVEKERGWHAVYDCERCGMTITSTLAGAVVDHPAVVGFHYDHGIDMRRAFVWELDWFSPESATVVNDDPWRATIDFAFADETLTVTLDASLEVVAVERGKAV